MSDNENTTISNTRHSGMFKPGASGNPLGRPKSDVTIRELAKAHTEGAIHTLAKIMNDPKASHTARVHAACALLDRGWGKPAQYVESVHMRLSYLDFIDQLVAADEKRNSDIIDL
jgi:hypothetical protein